MTALCLMTALLATGCGAGTRHEFLITDAMNSPKAKEILAPDIKVEFASGNGKLMRHGVVTRKRIKKSDTANKSIEEACTEAFLTVVEHLQESARVAGANKVINLISYYRKKPFSSTTRYECYEGGVVANVTLKGDLAQ